MFSHLISELASKEIGNAIRDLFVAIVVLGAYHTAREGGPELSRMGVLWRGLLWCGGIAFFIAATLGKPSCEVSGDPPYGGCEQYSDDGFEATDDQRTARFLYFLVLLSTPAVLGVADRKEKR